MDKSLELLRRLLVVILWICGAGTCVILVGLGLWVLIDMLFIKAGNYDGEWWLPIVMPLCGIIALVVAFALHIAINWIFQKNE